MTSESNYWHEQHRDNKEERFDPKLPPHPVVPWLWGPENAPRPIEVTKDLPVMLPGITTVEIGYRCLKCPGGWLAEIPADAPPDIAVFCPSCGNLGTVKTTFEEPAPPPQGGGL